MTDSWISGNSYERFMGRWSTLIAQRFLEWLAVPPAHSWLDVGCGPGSLTRLILEMSQPSDMVAIDSSAGFIAYARQSIANSAVRFEVGDAQSLPIDSNSVDATVSGLMLNFVPNPRSAIREFSRVTRPGGKIGIFMWDYAAGMKMLRYFWDAAVMLDPSAEQFDEGTRFQLCLEGQLKAIAQSAGLKQIETTAIEVTTVFQNFDDYWNPFLYSVGPAPSYVLGLDERDRRRLKKAIHGSLPIADDGSISLLARAWAVKGEG